MMVLSLLFAAGLAATEVQDRPAAVVPVTLADAIARVRAASPLREPAVDLVNGATAAAAASGRRLNPVIDFRGENFGAPSSRLPLDTFAVVMQTIEIGGKREARAGVADGDRRMAAAALDLVDRDLSQAVVRAYLEALRSRAHLATLRGHRDTVATLVEAVRRRVAEGRTAEFDLRRFETEASRLDIDIARATVALTRDLGRLAAVLGAPPLQPEQLVEPALPPLPPEPVDVASFVTRHPDLRAAEARVVRARHLRALEEARRLPDPTVQAGYKRTAGIDTAVAGVLVPVPIFDRNNAARARAAGDEAAATAERRAILLRLTAEARTSLEAAKLLADRVEHAPADLLEPAAIVRQAANATFREGTADVLRLIDAERVYADVTRVAFDLRLDAIAAAIEARLALAESPVPQP